MSDSNDWKRVKIAEFCRWRRSSITGKWIHSSNESDKHFNSAWVSDTPDYLNDLNAMHEAEKALGDVHSITSCEYDDWLTCITGNDQTWRATAAQRAEAFGLTLGLWKPDQTEP